MKKKTFVHMETMALGHFGHGHFGHGHFGHGRFDSDISAMDISAMENAEVGRFGHNHKLWV